MPCFCVGRQAVLGDEPPFGKGKKPPAVGLKDVQHGGLPPDSKGLIGTAVSTSGQIEPEALSEQPSEQPSEQHSERQRGEGSAESAEPLLAEGGAAAEDGSAGEQAEGAEQSGSQQEELHSSAVDEPSMPLDAAEPSGSLAAAAEAEPSSLQDQGSPEGSQAALLLAADDASHISLKQPRLSRLSGLLSACASARSGGDSGESYARQQQPATQQQGTPQVGTSGEGSGTPVAATLLRARRRLRGAITVLSSCCR